MSILAVQGLSALGGKGEIVKGRIINNPSGNLPLLKESVLLQLKVENTPREKMIELG